MNPISRNNPIRKMRIGNLFNISHTKNREIYPIPFSKTEHLYILEHRKHFPTLILSKIEHKHRPSPIPKMPNGMVWSEILRWHFKWAMLGMQWGILVGILGRSMVLSKRDLSKYHWVIMSLRPRRITLSSLTLLLTLIWKPNHLLALQNVLSLLRSRIILS